MPPKWEIYWGILMILTTSFGFTANQCQFLGRNNSGLSAENEVRSVQRDLKEFISVISKGDNGKAISYFSENAFSNEAMFSESCAGFIKDSDRKSRAAIKAGVIQFIGEFEKTLMAETQSLDGRSHFAEFASHLGHKACNDAIADGFALIRLQSSEIRKFSDNEAGNKFLEKNLLSKELIVSFVPIGEGICYFFWIKENDRWRIYHADLVCM
jgi:hypothetical protein